MKRIVSISLLLASLFVFNFCFCANASSILEIVPEESQIIIDQDVFENSDISSVGEYFDFQRILNFIIEKVKDYFPDFTKFLATLIAFVILFSLLDHFSFSKLQSGYQLVISSVTCTVFSLYLVQQFAKVCTLLEENTYTIRVFCDASVPILTALLLEGGKSFTAYVFTYSMSLCGTLTNQLTHGVFLPFIKIMVAIGCCSNLWDGLDTEPLIGLIQKFIKWAIGIIFSLFSFSMSLQNTLAKSADNTAKKMLKNAAQSIPYFGNTLSQGLDGIYVLVDNSRTMSASVGVLVIASLFCGPAIMIALQSVALYLASCVSGLLGQKTCVSILKTIQKAYLLLLGIFLITIVMCSISFLLVCNWRG